MEDAGEARGRIRVLMIDDHEMFADGLSRLLEREDDFEIVGVRGTVAEGVSVAEATHPDVALVDWRLPDGSGADATASILRVSASTRVLVVTGSDDDDALVRAIEAGCSGFITKDRAVRELVDAVRLTHAGEAYIAPDKLVQLLPQFARASTKATTTALSAREEEVLRLIATGLSNKAIADQLYLSVFTVRNHVRNALAKLNAHSKLEAVAIATREGLLRA